MKYIKLIAVQVDDFFSTIVFEKNYSIKQEVDFLKKKSDLEEDGYICILANMNSNLIL